MHCPSEITRFLIQWSSGDQTALDKLLPLVEIELHRLAHQHLRRFRIGDTLQTADLINETYLRLVDQRNVHWQNRAHFFGIAAQLMRRVLLNHIRNQKRLKRGGRDCVQVSLSEAVFIAAAKTDELLLIDQALDKLAKFDQRKCKVVELRFFGGMSVEETAEVLKVSQITVMRDWSLAKAWLAREIKL